MPGDMQKLQHEQKLTRSNITVIHAIALVNCELPIYHVSVTLYEEYPQNSHSLNYNTFCIIFAQ